MAKKSDPQYVVNLGSRLMKAKEEVKALQAEWDALFVGSEAKVQQPPANKPPTLVHSVLVFLGENRGIAFSADTIANELVISNKQSLATTLSKMVRKGTIKKYGSDKYTSIKSEIIGADIEQDHPSYSLAS